MADKFLIWWTSQSDCERIAPLDSWPTLPVTLVSTAYLASAVSTKGH